MNKVLLIFFMLLTLVSFGQQDENAILTDAYIDVIELLIEKYELDTIYVDPDIRITNFPNEVSSAQLISLSKSDHYAFKDKIPARSIIFSLEHMKLSKRKYQITVYPEMFTGKIIYNGSDINPELTNDFETLNMSDDRKILKLIRPEDSDTWELWDAYELNRY